MSVQHGQLWLAVQRNEARGRAISKLVLIAGGDAKGGDMSELAIDIG